MTSHNAPPVMSVSMSIMTTDASKAAGKTKAFKKESKAASPTHQKDEETSKDEEPIKERSQQKKKRQLCQCQCRCQ